MAILNISVVINSICFCSPSDEIAMIHEFMHPCSSESFLEIWTHQRSELLDLYISRISRMGMARSLVPCIHSTVHIFIPYIYCIYISRIRFAYALQRAIIHLFTCTAWTIYRVPGWLKWPLFISDKSTAHLAIFNLNEYEINMRNEDQLLYIPSISTLI